MLIAWLAIDRPDKKQRQEEVIEDDHVFDHIIRDLEQHMRDDEPPDFKWIHEVIAEFNRPGRYNKNRRLKPSNDGAPDAKENDSIAGGHCNDNDEDNTDDNDGTEHTDGTDGDENDTPLSIRDNDQRAAQELHYATLFGPDLEERIIALHQVLYNPLPIPARAGLSHTTTKLWVHQRLFIYWRQSAREESVWIGKHMIFGFVHQRQG